MKFLLYSDKNYESMVEAFLISRKYTGAENIPVLFYSVGFKCDLDYPNLEKIEWDFNPDLPDMTYYKPDILIDGLNYSDEICYMDSDIVLGKRFDKSILQNPDGDHPIASSGPQEFMWRWESIDGITYRYDEKKLMDYFGVAERSCAYLWASMISYNNNCMDFLLEWKSILLNPYLLMNKKEYFPMREETAYNVTLWKRKCEKYLDLVFFNTISYDSFVDVETDSLQRKEMHRDYADDNMNPALYETLDDSNKVLFYHGFKPGEDLDNVVAWMKERTNE